MEAFSPRDQAARQEWRRRHFVPRRIPLSYTPCRVPRNVGLFQRAVDWLLPWQRRDYPGKQLGITLALAGVLTWNTIKGYLRGRATFSARVALALRDLIAARVASGQALMAELEKHAAERAPGKDRQRRAGFMAVDPTTGLSGRVKVGKRRAVRDV